MTEDIAEFVKYRWRAGDGITEARERVRQKFGVVLPFSALHPVFLRMDKGMRA